VNILSSKFRIVADERIPTVSMTLVVFFLYDALRFSKATILLRTPKKMPQLSGPMFTPQLPFLFLP